MPKFTEFPRQRLTRTAAPSGLYGTTMVVQRAAEAASRKLARQALRVAKRVFARDEQVVPFLQAHAKREGSKSAKVLLAAMKEIGPKLASEMRGGIVKDAGAAEYGLYGFKARTADLGLDACKEIRSAAGRISADLHRRKGDAHGPLTGFFKEHSKQAGCAYAGLLLSCYPDAGSKFAGTAPSLGVPTAGPDFSFDASTGKAASPFVVHEVTASTGTLGKVVGHIRDAEVFPNVFRVIRQAALSQAAAEGVAPEQVRFDVAPDPGRLVASAFPNADGRSRDVEGELLVRATWPGALRPVHVRAPYTAEYEPMPFAGDKTVLASGDWIEWEE